MKKLFFLGFVLIAGYEGFAQAAAVESDALKEVGGDWVMGAYAKNERITDLMRFATFCDYGKMFEALDEDNADPNAQSKPTGLTPLMCVARSNFMVHGSKRKECTSARIECMRLLLEFRANPLIADAKGLKAWENTGACREREAEYLKENGDHQLLLANKGGILDSAASAKEGKNIMIIIAEFLVGASQKRSRPAGSTAN